MLPGLKADQADSDAASQDFYCQGGPPAAWQGPIGNKTKPENPFNVPQYIRARYCKRYKKIWDKIGVQILRC